MARTFGDHLKLFALSIDVVDRYRFNEINRMINKYCNEVLDIDFVKLWLASEVEGQTGVKRYSLGNIDVENTRRIKDDGGQYKGQICLAFDKKCPLWIVSASGKQKLQNSGKYKDLWSGLRSIPAYRPVDENAEESATKTSIIVPVLDKGNVLGVLNFETKEYLEITEEAKLELSKVAETVGILLRLNRGTERQRENTDSAFEQIRGVLSKPHPKLTKPKIFFASSSQAKQDVIQVVLDTLKEYENLLDLIYWKAIDNPGNITVQLLESINMCRYAICYFSEKMGETDSDNEYRDNPNVLFEAGMFHGRTDELSSKPKSWIPIREKNSPSLPFDFAQERILEVVRSKSGRLNSKTFAAKLRRRLDSLLRR